MTICYDDRDGFPPPCIDGTEDHDAHDWREVAVGVEACTSCGCGHHWDHTEPRNPEDWYVEGEFLEWIERDDEAETA